MKRFLTILLAISVSIFFGGCVNSDTITNSTITSGSVHTEIEEEINSSEEPWSGNSAINKPTENSPISSDSSSNKHNTITDKKENTPSNVNTSSNTTASSSSNSNLATNNAEKYTKGLKFGDCMWGNGYSVWSVGTATETNIIIPSTYNGKPVIEICENAFKDRINVKSVSIPSSVLEIGTNAFSGCTALETVSIAEGLTSIYSKAFYNCDSLKQINIPNSVEGISKNSFENCDNLKYNEYNNGLYLGNESNPYSVLITAKSCDKLILNNQARFIAHDALSNNLQIKQVIISNSVRFIGRNAFLGCKNLTNITFGNGLERIYIYAFKDCKSLESAIFAQNQTWGVNKYGYGTNLTTISTNDANINAYNLKNRYCDYFWGHK